MENYNVLATLKKGNFGECSKIQRKSDGKVLVWKKINYRPMTKTQEAKLKSEVKLLRDLNHPNIVRYYEDFGTKSGGTIYIVMEYCGGGDLLSYIHNQERKNIPERFIWKIANQIIMAVEYCHNRSRNGKATLHRDIKPANVLLTSKGDAKLADFGASRLLDRYNSVATTFEVGTMAYKSPEHISRQSYSAKSDVWAVGILLYELSTLHFPFNLPNLEEKICRGKFAKIPKMYTADLEEFISLMIVVDVAERPTMNMLLNHAILKKHR